MKTRTLIFGVLFAAIAAAGSVHGQGNQAAAQQPAGTFRAEVNYVEVDARVLDAQGKFIPDLKPGDFQVIEDGKPQQVTAFSLVNIPVERRERPLFASKPIEADVRTNVEAADGRVYLIVLDTLHTNALRSQRIKLAARQFVEKYLGANDLAAVIHTAGVSNANQDFTNSQRLLLRSIDRFMGQKLTSSTMNRIGDVQRRAGTAMASDPAVDMDDRERGYNARATLDTMRNLAQYLGNVRGRRKAMVFFSEGIDYNIYDFMSPGLGSGGTEATSVMDANREMIAAATRANVAVYGVDPRGLGAGMEDLTSIQSFPDDTSLGLGQSALFNEVRLGQDSLRVMSEETGGFAVVNRNDFTTAFQRIVDDNSAYYLLGYYSTNDRRDGRYRKIEVKLNHKPGLSVRARKGYVAARGRAPETKPTTANSASPELREALDGPLPMTGLPLGMTAAVFKGPAPNGSVVLSTIVSGNAIPFAEAAGTFKNDLEVIASATDDKGKTFWSDRQTVNLNMKPDTMNRVKATGFRVIQSMDLAPGRYQLRVGVREANTKKAGSVTFDLDVPEFAKAPLTMSSLALTSAMSGAAPTIRPKDPLEKLLPGPLSSYREFPVADEIAFFAEVYDNIKPAHKVEITATVKAEGGQIVFQTREERESSELAGSGGGYGFQARVPLKAIAPGLYVLRVEAIAQIGDRNTIFQETVFRVMPMQGQTP